MVQFSAVRFYFSTGLLCSLEKELLRGVSARGDQSFLTEVEVLSTRKVLNELKRVCEPLQLKRVLERLESEPLPSIEVGFSSPINLEKLLWHLQEIRDAFAADLNERLFLYIPPDSAAYYDKDDLFGVKDRIQDAAEDIRSAGNCIACGLFTASVFHSMRVAEFGLRSIASKLRVKVMDRGKPHPIEYATWGKVIDKCKSKIGIISKRPVGPKRQAALEFYSDAADHCLFMKDIWRNNISHTRKPYNEPEAIAVFERVKDFMRFVAVNIT